MFTMNGLCAIGRGFVAGDVELRHFEGNKRAFVEVSVSFQRSYYNEGKKEWIRNSHFIPVVAYGTVAERFARECSKGTLVMISGYIEQESFTPNGSDKKITRHRLVAEDFCVCTKSERNGNGNGNGVKTDTNGTMNKERPEAETTQAEESTAPPVNQQRKSTTKPQTQTDTAPEVEPQSEDDGTSEEVADLPF